MCPPGSIRSSALLTAPVLPRNRLRALIGISICVGWTLECASAGPLENPSNAVSLGYSGGNLNDRDGRTSLTAGRVSRRCPSVP